MSRCVQCTAHYLADLSDRVMRAFSIQCGTFASALRPLHDSCSLNCDISSAVDRFGMWKAILRNRLFLIYPENRKRQIKKTNLSFFCPKNLSPGQIFVDKFGCSSFPFFFRFFRFCRNSSQTDGHFRGRKIRNTKIFLPKKRTNKKPTNLSWTNQEHSNPKI